MHKAKAHLKRAREIADSTDVTEREKLYVDAFNSWMGGDLHRAYNDFKKAPLPATNKYINIINR
jgi:hypothetical protein